MSLVPKFLQPREASRSTLFRRRRVIFALQELQNGSFATTQSVELSEITNVKERAVGGTGVAKGSIAAVLQAWYISPITIEITGKSYMGTFSDSKFNEISVDNDIESLLRIRDRINNIFLQTNEVKDFRILLLYGLSQNGDSVADRGVSQALVGFFDEISTDEADDRPYIKTYTIRFTGELLPDVSVFNGAVKQRADIRVINSLRFGEIRTR